MNQRNEFTWLFVFFLIVGAVFLAGCEEDEKYGEENKTSTVTVEAPLVRDTIPPGPIRNTLPPSPSSTASLTPTIPYYGCPTDPPLVTVLVNSFCRSGPSIDYDKLTTFTPGSQIPLAGYYRQKNGTIWWNVIRPDTNTDCWIFEDLVSVCIPLDDVPLLTPPPTPTPRPLPGGGGGGGGLHCDPLAHSEAACGDGAWDDDYHECDCSVLCGHFGDQASCEAHSTWYCSWNGSACVVP
jgi:hypothetical protein